MIALHIEGGPKSKPLSRIIIKSHYKPSVKLDFSSFLSINKQKHIISLY